MEERRYPELAIKIKQIRGELSQEEFAKSISCSRSFIVKIEGKERKSLGHEMLWLIRNKYKISMDFFFEANMNLEEAKSLYQSELLLRLLNSFNPETRCMFEKLAISQFKADTLDMSDRLKTKRNKELEDILDKMEL